uniref:RNA-binding motif protein, X-linked 2 n=1 Tax=Caligus clemensi TaxID=344056 RepID=C1C1E0_CALCM|nr:RNA-binding motif protein, X-linked 2 [Caligus clemensi]
MNPITNAKNLAKMNQRELELGIAGTKGSWHYDYKDSAWIFMGGLNYELSEGDIISIFSQYGEVVHINLVRDGKTGKSKGFAFLCYEDQRSTILAVDDLNAITLLKRTIRVDHVQTYKLPKDLERLDEDKRKLFMEGCAPKPLPPDSNDSNKSSDNEESSSSSSQESTPKKEKKKKKHKKGRDSSSSSSSSSLSSESEDSSSRHRKKKSSSSRRRRHRSDSTKRRIPVKKEVKSEPRAKAKIEEDAKDRIKSEALSSGDESWSKRRMGKEQNHQRPFVKTEPQERRERQTHRPSMGSDRDDGYRRRSVERRCAKDDRGSRRRKRSPSSSSSEDDRRNRSKYRDSHSSRRRYSDEERRSRR